MRNGPYYLIRNANFVKTIIKKKINIIIPTYTLCSEELAQIELIFRTKRYTE